MSLTSRQSLIIGAICAALMVLTRSHHVADLTHLPDASWAIFFLAGFYLGTGRFFAVLLGLALCIDYAAITFGGVSSFCVSPAYAFLLPAYGALFLAGRWYASRYRFAWSTVVPFLASTVAGTVVCELLSSGGFYFFSGRFAQTSVAEFGARLIHYFPGNLQSMAFYLGVAAIVHVAATLVRHSTPNPAPRSGHRRW